MLYFIIRLLLSFLGPEEDLNKAIDNADSEDIVQAFAKYATSKHLVLAARANNLKLVQILLPHVDKSEIVDIEMKNGAVRQRDALWYAILHGNWPMIDLLMCNNDRVELIYHVMAHRAECEQYIPVLLQNCEYIGDYQKAIRLAIQYCNEKAFYALLHRVEEKEALSTILHTYIQKEVYVVRLRAYERMMTELQHIE